MVGVNALVLVESVAVSLLVFPSPPPDTVTDEQLEVRTEAAHEMVGLSQKMEGILRQVYSPDGINLGMNVGRAAGAGVAGGDQSEQTLRRLRSRAPAAIVGHAG